MSNPSTPASTIRRKNYTLNTPRSLAKKLEATLRGTPIQFFTTGGGLRIDCDAGTYEQIKNAMMAYYKTYKSYQQIKVEIVESEDMKDSNSETIIKLTYASQKKCYTINMYHTTSKLLINGKGLSRFKNVDLPKLMKLVDMSSNLNNLMQQALLLLQQK